MEFDFVYLLGQLTLVGLSLAVAGIAYLAWLGSGIANATIKTKTWSWGRFRTDIGKTLIAVLVVFAIVCDINLAEAIAALIGLNISDGANIVSTTVIVATALTGAVTYLKKALANVWRLWKFKPVDASTLKQDVDYQSVGEGVIDLVDTILGKTAKEQLEEDGVTGEVLEGEELKVEEAGMGGFVNTYIEPYRSKPQDSILDPSTCYNRECVSYTAFKIFELTGKWPTRTGGMNAKYWVQRLAENGYTKIVDKPQNGGKYVGVTEQGTYGHVIWFEFDNVVSEYNYSIRGGFDTRTVNLSAYKWVEIKAPDAASAPAIEADKVSKNVVTYTYKQGDTFGQVIRSLGLETSHGLWGTDGDVNYYTEQLHKQGIYGNIPVGTTIKLKKRS